MSSLPAVLDYVAKPWQWTREHALWIVLTSPSPDDGDDLWQFYTEVLSAIT